MNCYSSGGKGSSDTGEKGLGESPSETGPKGDGEAAERSQEGKEERREDEGE